MGLIKVYFCFIYSQNNTLQELWLSGNMIGDVGAASIGDALTYVQSHHPQFHFHFFHFWCYTLCKQLSNVTRAARCFKLAPLDFFAG
jgi:hypothetical protein